MSLGICMEGLEDFVFGHVEQTRRYTGEWNYLEIGVAAAQTLMGVADCAAAQGGDWRAIGVDLPSGWSLDLGHIGRTYPTIKIIDGARRGVPASFALNEVSLLLIPGGSGPLLASSKLPELSLALVDGCHERECCAKDFEALEAQVRKGGCVMFHDAGQDQRGGQPQPHCGKPIDVYGALCDLGLVDGIREGWSPVQWCKGAHATMAAVYKL